MGGADALICRELRRPQPWFSASHVLCEMGEHAKFTPRVAGSPARMTGVDVVEVDVAHSERATLRVGGVFFKIDADQARTDIDLEAMATAPIPTPQILWRQARRRRWIERRSAELRDVSVQAEFLAYIVVVVFEAIFPVFVVQVFGGAAVLPSAADGVHDGRGHVGADEGHLRGEGRHPQRCVREWALGECECLEGHLAPAGGLVSGDDVEDVVDLEAA